MNIVNMLLAGAIVEMQERLITKIVTPYSMSYEAKERANTLIDLGDDILCAMHFDASDWGPWTVINGYTRSLASLD